MGRTAHMKNRYISVCILVLLFIFISSKTATSDDASISLTGTYGGSGTDIAFQSIQTIDGGYALVGITNSFGNDGFDCWLVKTNQNGTVEWDKYYGGNGTDAASSIVQTTDSGYALVGYTNSFENNDFDFFLIKTSITGEIEWYKTYGGTSEDRATRVIETNDGGYALVGYTNYINDDNYDYFLIKTDKNGDIQWYQTYGGKNLDKASYLIQSNDGGFLIVGETLSFGAGNYDFWVVKTDSNGFEEWNRTFGGKNIDSAKTVVQSDDGGFLIVGETLSFGAGIYDFWVVKTDSNGFEEWNRTFGWKDSDHAQAAIQTEDHGFLISGYSERLLSYNFQIFKINMNGYLQWEKNYSSNVDIFANSMVKTTDNEYLLAGFVLLENPNMNFFMLKTNLSGFNNSNLYPIADAGNDESVEVGENVSFNASGFDPDGKIIRYRWDFDGDGLFDWESNNSSITNHSFLEEEIYKSYLEVTDNNNSKNIDMKVIVVDSTKKGITYSGIHVEIWIYFFLMCMLLGIFIMILIYEKRIIPKIENNYIYKRLSLILRINKWYKYIIISFVILTIIKFMISLLFNKPFIYSDEFIYGVVANKISKGTLLILGDVPFSPVLIPTGYSYCLAPAYLFKDNMDIVYHCSLLINSILTSLLIIPTFFIMRKFVDEKRSFITAIIVATLPIIFAHNFALLSENLFYLLFLISCILVLKTFSYDKFNKFFIFWAVLTGFSVGLLIMTRALGIAVLGGLVCVFLFKIFKNRKISSLKYGLVFLPFLPAFIIGYLIYSKTIFFIGYPGSGYIDVLSLIFSNFSNIVRFTHLILNEINYFILMSYIIFMTFTIFLIYHRKQFTNEKRENLSIFLIYGFFTIFFLSIITAVHIFSGENDVYSRYVSLGLPLIFITGVIGITIFEKIKNQKKYFQFSTIFIFLGIICIFLLPSEIKSLVNNLDLIWLNYATQFNFFMYNLLDVFRIFLSLFFGICAIIIIFKWIKLKNLVLIKNILKHISLIFLLSIILSAIFFIPALHTELFEGGGSENNSNNGIARWFMEKDPKAYVILEDQFAALSGGGMNNEGWHSFHVNMHYWMPSGEVKVMDRENLSNFILSRNTSADYIVSTHDLTQYYPLVQDFYMNIEVWPIKKQPYVDWHIYKIK